jgi:glycosyltransferase involved in cell wall biosynthesis
MTTLSIAIPFFRDDPTDLIQALGRLRLAEQTSLTIADDGTGDAALTERIKVALADYPGEGRLITLATNQGRSAARNALIEAASGAFILFLDADMAPDNPDFIEQWLTLIANQNPPIAFGGFTTAQVSKNRANALTYYLARTTDCPALDVRAARGPLAVATSNLLVRRDVIAAVPFDAGFSGWGWEDVDWAMRASARFAIHHVDIPATHLGLDDAATLLRKYRGAGPNLKRLLACHPEAGTLQGIKVALALARLPHKTFRPVWSFLARDPFGMTPMALRGLSAKLWRASWAAEAIA